MAPSGRCRAPSTEEQDRRYRELVRQLAEQPEIEVREHQLEDREPRLRRWLRSQSYDVSTTAQKLREHARWWRDFGMDSFIEGDELDERGPLFVCGEDLAGRPTLIARPAAHVSHCREDSVRAARRCVYTMQRVVERMQPGVESTMVIYDAANLSTRNLDLVFSRELVPVLFNHFPERLFRVLVVNNHWTMGFFWTAVGALLDPSVKAKIAFLGSSNLCDELGAYFPSSHPYLRYLSACRGRRAAEVALPSRQQRGVWATAKVETECELGKAQAAEGGGVDFDAPGQCANGAAAPLKVCSASSQSLLESEPWSRQSTAATQADVRSPRPSLAETASSHSDLFQDVEEVENVVELDALASPSTASTMQGWWFPCACARRTES